MSERLGPGPTPSAMPRDAMPNSSARERIAQLLRGTEAKPLAMAKRPRSLSMERAARPSRGADGRPPQRANNFNSPRGLGSR